MPAGGTATPAFPRKGGKELFETGRSAGRAFDFPARAHDELFEESSAFVALVFEDGHRPYLFAGGASPAFSAAPLSTLSWFVVPDRSPVPHTLDIQVGTPRRGSRNFIRTIQTTMNIKTLIMAFIRPFEPVFASSTDAAAGFRPPPAPSSPCKESCISHPGRRSKADRRCCDGFSAKERNLLP